MAGKLAGRRILITGASAGMGRATAVRMAEEGAAGLALVGRNEERLAQVSREVEVRGAQAVTHAVDLVDIARARQCVTDSIADLGGLDVVVNNAGDTISEGFLEARDESIAMIMAADFTSGFVIAQQAARHMIAVGSRGVILFTAALAEDGGLPHNPIYSAAKAATINLVRSLAPVLGPYGIRVNAVSPGFTERTRMYTAAGAQDKQAMWDTMATVMPLRRLGTPEEIAAVFTFLASDDAAYITGANILVDGGVTADSVSVPWLEALQGRLIAPGDDRKALPR